MRILAPAASATLIAALALSVAAVSVSATTVPAADVPPWSAGAEQPGSAHLRSAAPARITGSGRTEAANPSGASSPLPVVTRVTSRAVFGWPLSPRPAVLRRFDQPRNQWSPGHRGVDLAAAVGAPVLSAGGGVVAFSGMIAGRGVLTVRHPGGLRTSYEPVDDRLRSGTLVQRGSRIGLISPAAGHCVPITCLHWGAISGRAYRDPLSLLGLGRPILLPLG